MCNETAKRIQARRSELKKDYKEIYEAVSEILFRHDPIGINFDTNDDEYEPEVDTILPRLKDCESPEDVLRIVHQEFQMWFGEEMAGAESLYEKIADEIWILWKNREKK